MHRRWRWRTPRGRAPGPVSAAMWCRRVTSTRREKLSFSGSPSGAMPAAKATVRRPFSLVGHGTLKNWHEGDTFELAVRPKKVGEDWRIAGF